MKRFYKLANNLISLDLTLANEKYVGDSLFQKTYTTDTLPFKEKVNRGERPQYYLKGSHQGFIDRDVFEKAQKLMQIRGNGSKNQIAHLFTHRILCPICQTHFRAVNASGKTYWICPSSYKTDKESHSVRFHETTLKAVSINMMAKAYIHQAYSKIKKENL